MNNGAFFTEDQLAPIAQVELEGFAKMSKDIKRDTINISKADARYLVDIYYQIQKVRIATGNQISAIMRGTDGEGNDPNSALVWTNLNMKHTEKQIQDMMNAFVQGQRIGRWISKVKGMGPVLSAALIANLDITKCTYYNQFHSFCGLNDNNIPWLGTTKANNIVSSIYESLRKEDDEITAALADKFSKKNVKNFNTEMTKFFKHFVKQDNYAKELESIFELKQFDADNALATNVDILNFLFASFEDDADRVADYLLRSNSKNIVTTSVLQKVVEKTNRKMDSIMHGTTISATTGKNTGKFVNPTATALKSYLAKPPYNTNLKTTCFLISNSFVKVKNRGSLYGKLYDERKSLEMKRNEEGFYAEQAEIYLAEKNWGKETESYKAYCQGKLPKNQIHRRALRYSVKMFISHLFEAMYIDYHGHRPPQEVYPIAYLGHSDYIEPEVPYDMLSD